MIVPPEVNASKALSELSHRICKSGIIGSEEANRPPSAHKTVRTGPYTAPHVSLILVLIDSQWECCSSDLILKPRWPLQNPPLEVSTTPPPQRQGKMSLQMLDWKIHTFFLFHPKCFHLRLIDGTDDSLSPLLRPGHIDMIHVRTAVSHLFRGAPTLLSLVLHQLMEISWT